MKKLTNKKGFTLMEMLIVVAIIVILVAVSIPTFTSSLSSAKDAADDANERAAKAIAATKYLENNGAATSFCYDANTGKPLDTCPGNTLSYGQNETGHVHVSIDASGNVTFTWGTSHP